MLILGLIYAYIEYICIHKWKHILTHPYFSTYKTLFSGHQVAIGAHDEHDRCLVIEFLYVILTALVYDRLYLYFESLTPVAMDTGCFNFLYSFFRGLNKIWVERVYRLKSVFHSLWSYIKTLLFDGVGFIIIPM